MKNIISVVRATRDVSCVYTDPHLYDIMRSTELRYAHVTLNAHYPVKPESAN